MGETLPPAAVRLSAWLASGKLALARHYVEWSVRSPSIGADSAITAMAQEEIGHAAILRPTRGGEMRLPPFDELEPPHLRAPLTAWAGLIGTAAVVEAALTCVIEAVAEGGCVVLARRVPKMLAEERYHTQFLDGWISEICHRADRKAALAAAAEGTVEAIRPWVACAARDPALGAEGVFATRMEPAIGAAIEGAARQCRQGAG